LVVFFFANLTNENSGSFQGDRYCSIWYKSKYMITSNKDISILVTKTIHRLDENGHYFEWGKKFREALNISYMPGEWLGAIRSCYIDLNKTTIPAELMMSDEINEVIVVLNRALDQNQQDL
jgi:hypothetical protein